MDVTAIILAGGKAAVSAVTKPCIRLRERR